MYHIHTYTIYDRYLLTNVCIVAFQTPQKHAEELAEQTSSSSGAAGTAAATPGSAASSSSASVGQLPPQFPNVSAHQADYEAEEEAGLELPPPMKPIQEPHLIANGPPAFPKDLKESSANMVSDGALIVNGKSIYRSNHEQY